MQQMKRPVGLTKTVGFQIGVRRTLPIHYTNAWQLLTSNQVVNLWLGKVERIDFTEGAKYQLADGSAGQVKIFKLHSHLRISFKTPAWQRASTIQIRVIPKGDKTVIAFHQEHLPGTKERKERRAHYMVVLDELEHIISKKLS